MKEKIQKFGGSLLAPVMLFTFFGIVVAFATLAKNQQIFGTLAADGTVWRKIWSIVETGGWTVFNQMELLFVVGLPIGLAKKAHARACLSSLTLYLTYNYFISGILTNFGSAFGVDFTQDPSSANGLKLIAGIKTFNTGVLGAILISALCVYLHNKFFDKKLPDILGIFQGTSFVVIIGFCVMVVAALATCFIWPYFQAGITGLQSFLLNTGMIGLFFYSFLNTILIPFGLHHFIYMPVGFGPALVEQGTVKYWVEHLNEFAMSTLPIQQQFPAGVFGAGSFRKIFGCLGIAIAIYLTAKKENKKKVLALLIPITATAVLTGITEPLEFTFLFVAPFLFLIHSLLSSVMSVCMVVFGGFSGSFGNGLVDLVTKNWIPLWHNQWQTYLVQMGIGLIFVVIYVVVFRYFILKNDYKTPGREEESIQFYTKKDYKEKKAQQGNNAYLDTATAYLECLGGKENISSVTNCATRLRVGVKNPELLYTTEEFKLHGAHGVVRDGKAIQVIVGLSVPQVREEFENLL